MQELDDRWLSVTEIVKYLGVSEDTVYRWRYEKCGPAVSTLEEKKYPLYYYRTTSEGEEEVEQPAQEVPQESEAAAEPKGQHLQFMENQRGVSYDQLFGAYLKGVTRITITDMYIRKFYQIRNIMEFMETVIRYKAPEDEVVVHLVTGKDDYHVGQQIENLERIQESCTTAGIQFTWEFSNKGTQHARHIVADNGWEISIGRGLDIF